MVKCKKNSNFDKLSDNYQTKIRLNNLEQTVTAAKEIIKTAPRLSKNSKLFKSIISAIQDKKGEKIVSLDLKKIDEAVADYFILCEARSNIQIKAIAQSIEQKIEEECGERPFHIEFGDTWTLVDYVNIVVHVFKEEQREFYNLEGLWEDAPKSNY